MTSELSFLIELLLNHELPKPTKDLLAVRIKEVEEHITMSSAYPKAPISQAPLPLPPNLAQQAPSTLALMVKHGDVATMPVHSPVEAPKPVTVIAQTPATMAAMQSRQQAISAALEGKVDKSSGKPRKW